MIIIAFFSFVIALILLVVLAVIDFKTMLLPNKYVFPFAGLGIIFHLSTKFSELTYLEVIAGGVIGYGILWLIRFFGSMYYKREALGLGDVKLLGAAGLWLGASGMTFAMTLGAMAGLVHGLVYAYLLSRKTGKFDIQGLKIPAGPGFVFGIFIIMWYQLFPVFLR